MTLQQPTTSVALKHVALSIQTGPFGSQLHAEDYCSGGRPVVNPAHLRDGRIEPDPDSAIDEETFRRLAQHELQAGDVVVGRRGELGRCGLVTPEQEGWVCGTGSIRVRPNTRKLEARWLRWFLSWSGTRDWLSLESVGTTMENLGAEVVGALPIPLIAVATQRVIADYLDRETARIDALIAAKERVLALLAEKRRALITRAVTRGLDPHAPLRDSGIPWLGEVPAQWGVVRLRFLARHIEQGWSPQAENREPAEEEWGVLKLNAVNKGRFDDSAAKALPADVEPLTGLEIRAGDFLVTRANTPALVGDVCFVEVTRPRLMLCDLIYRLSLRVEFIDGQFLAHFLSLPIGRRQVESNARGTSNSMVKVSQEHIKDWLTPLPPIQEQNAIVRRLAKELTPIQRIVNATERTVVLLKERRASLIAAAVTGQIDVGAAV